MITIEIATEALTLLPERGVYWARRETLFVADLHWGKAATFRAAGIALPGGTTSDDLARLGRLVGQTGARRLVLLGDLLHAKQGRAEATFTAIDVWRKQHPELHILLVRGNHDKRAGDPPAAWTIEVVDAPYVEAPFVLGHYPEPDQRGYVLAGHLHPGAVLGRGRQRLKLPCFWFGASVGVLPAFGSFTGSAAITPAPGDRVFVVAEDEVVAVS